jgi:hypothetical protein
MGVNPFRHLWLSPADGRRLKIVGKKRALASKALPHTRKKSSWRMGGCKVAAMKTNKDLSAVQSRALLRHSAVSWIEQCRNEGHSCGECLHRAAALAWDGRYYSARTLEEWYYAYRSAGFEALAGQPRSDSGKSRALQPQLAQRIAELRKTQPQLTVSAI